MPKNSNSMSSGWIPTSSVWIWLDYSYCTLNDLYSHTLTVRYVEDMTMEFSKCQEMELARMTFFKRTLTRFKDTLDTVNKSVWVQGYPLFMSVVYTLVFSYVLTCMYMYMHVCDFRCTTCSMCMCLYVCMCVCTHVIYNYLLLIYTEIVWCHTHAYAYTKHSPIHLCYGLVYREMNLIPPHNNPPSCFVYDWIFVVTSLASCCIHIWSPTTEWRTYHMTVGRPLTLWTLRKTWGGMPSTLEQEWITTGQILKYVYMDMYDF